jgi:cysteine desulfurase
LHGGPQERDRRAGTENLAGILTLGTVARWLTENASAEQERTARLGKRLRESVTVFPGVETTIREEDGLASTVHLRLPMDAEAVLIRLDLQGVCASTGSACSSGAAEPSETLLAMGWTPEEARRALRLSLGWNTTEAEIDQAAEILGRVLSAMRGAAAADL